MNDLISVIVPVYNVEKYICRCIDSLVNQTYKNLEIILVEDGSPDNCGKICDEYAKKDSRIKVIHQKNSGAPTARNNGMDNAHGKYIAFADSDDYIHPQMYEILLFGIKKYEADVAMCDFYEDEECDFEKLEEFSYIMTDNVDILDKMLISDEQTYSHVLWNKLFKKEKIGNTRMTPEYIIDDFDFVSRVLFNCEKIVETDAKLYYYEVNPQGIMHSEVYNPKKVMALEAIEKIAYNHKKYKNMQSYKKTIDYLVYILAYLLIDKCIAGEVREKKWIKYVKKYARKYFFEIWKRDVISLNRKIILTCSLINFNLAKKIYSSKRGETQK